LLQHLTGIRYVVPLREGGSLPAVVDTGGGRSFVVKFLGAGQGAKALVAEAIAAGLALALDLPVPEPAIITLGEGFGRSEPDEEIQDILRASVGANFGLEYLPGALGFDPAAERDIEPELAADIIWFDAYITNVDRTPRNPNLLVWKDRIWMIDHGASLYFHHQWQGWRDRIQSKFPMIQDHVLLGVAGDLAKADERLRSKLDEATIREIIDDIPEEWLGDEEEFADVTEHREAYVTYLLERLNGPRPWLQEAIEARERGPVPYTPRVTRRVV
jgi:hypothetical protein